MSYCTSRRFGARMRACLFPVFALLSCAAFGAQFDIHGPPGSVAFGTTVTVLPNGNLVVTDPDYGASQIGAVYLYDPNGNLISTLTGSSPNDHVGSYGIVMVGNGNFLVRTPEWNNGSATAAGAVTWMSGTTGVGTSAVVSDSNSLVGATSDDQVGYYVITALGNGNYVVTSPLWDNGSATNAGAATWGNGNSGISGAVSASNSLIGTTSGDEVGYYDITALSNGNYVVMSFYWNNGIPNAHVGAATWGNGASGITGAVSAGNSLVGTSSGDQVGSSGITALSNGNYVVGSYLWNHSTPDAHIGAATWGNGASGIIGTVSATNSLIGTTDGDSVGYYVTALANGNYVVASPDWNNGSPGAKVGAATWGNGASGTIGVVSPSNSLVGTTSGDQVGLFRPISLSNGNYVVGSIFWNNGTPGAKVGAATWGNGAVGTSGAVSASNSLVGTTSEDYVGYDIAALNSGNYAVASPFWNNGAPGTHVGAATWGNGTSGTSGVVSASNSLIGTTSGDQVSRGGIATLSNGNYVVGSPFWNNGTPGAQVGSATWSIGASGFSGTVSPGNSLIGTTSGDQVGLGITALSNGNYVVRSNSWNNNTPGAHVGAATWGNGTNGIVGMVSASNSLIGTTSGDSVGNVIALANGSYLVGNQQWNNGTIPDAGATTFASGAFRLKGAIQPWNSVQGLAANGGTSMYATATSYDAKRQRLAVGLPKENIVTLITLEQIFMGDFEP